MGRGLIITLHARIRRFRRMRIPAAAAVIALSVAVPQAALASPPPQSGHSSLSVLTSSGTAAPLLGASQPSGLIPLSSQSAPALGQLAAMSAAAASAKRTGRSVTVGSLTTPTQLITARPGGGFLLSAQVIPVRARAGGRWVPVSLNLARGASGRYAATATAYGTVSFSAGGTSPLAVTRSGATMVAVSWPGPLPAPVISGAAATYRSVLPGVDLQVSATPDGGFSDVLVVKNAASGRDPALARLSLPVRVAGGRAVAGSAGPMEVRSAGGGMSLLVSAPVMWDSRQTAAFGTRGAGRESRLNPDPSSAGAPGLGARVAPVTAMLARGTLTLLSDRAMLTSAATRWPVYIDPTFHWHFPSVSNPAFDQTKGAYPCDGVPEYDSTSSANDNGQLGAGYQGFAGGCEGNYHSYYQWKLPSVIWGSHIGPASDGTVVNAKEVYSATCDSSNYTVDMHQSGSIGSGTDWNNRPRALSGGLHATASFGNACSSNPSSSFDVSSAIFWAAKDHSSTFTVYLSEDGAESAGNDVPFKRFADNPSLQIAYNTKPDTPDTSQLYLASGSSKIGCATGTPYPVLGKSIATNTPVLNATVGDDDGDALLATFKYWINGSTATNTGLSADNISNGGIAKYSLPSSFTSGLKSGQVIDWQVTGVSDGEDSSGASSVCHVDAEPQAPGIPAIAPNSTYPEGQQGAAAGTAATFKFSNTGTTATYFVYGLDVQPSLSNPPSSEKATAVSNAGQGLVTPLAPGPHTLWVAAVDAAKDPSQWASYTFMAAGDPVTTCSSLSACYDNTAISSDSAMSQADADGTGNSYSATDLTNAGWTSGETATVDGARFTLPAYGSGKADNVLAANQQITYSYQVPSTGRSALMFLASSSHASFAAPTGDDSLAAAPFTPAGVAVSGSYCFNSTTSGAYCPASGTITYTDGTAQAYDLIVPDWISGPSALGAVTLPHENNPSGQSSTNHPRVYALSVPLQAGKTIASVTLPDVGTALGGRDRESQLHIFSLATRDATAGTIQANGTYVQEAAGQAWTGAWSSPTEGNYDAGNLQGGNFSNQTLRIALRPSLSGSTVRIKLDNALGTSKLTIGKATIALGSLSAGSPTAVPSGPFRQLTFGGSAGVTLPAGGMAFSDPLSFSVTAGQYLLVSFDLTNSIPYLVENTWTNTAYTFAAAPGTGDSTTDTTGNPFVNGGWFTNLLTGLDVSTAGVPTLAVLGDNLTDAWQSGTSPQPTDGANRLSDQIAAAEPTAPAPYGTLAEGIESGQIMTDNPETGAIGASGGPSVLSRIDRDILDQPGITTVVLNTGLEDTLNGQAAVNLENNGYTALLTYLQSAGINVIAVGQPPCGGYAGDQAATNDPCTSTADGYRNTVNNWLYNGPNSMNPGSVPALFYVDPDAALGVLNTTDGLQHLNSNADLGDHVNLTNPGYGALATAVMGPQDTWPLNDGSPASAASDTVPNVSWFNPNDGGSSAVLSATGATWTGDATRGTVLTLDGTAGNAATVGPLLNTSNSYSVSAWVKLTGAGSDRAALSQDGTSASGFQLGYANGTSTWQLAIPGTDTAAPAETVITGPTATIGTWTHLVAAYNAAQGQASLYVNGTLAGTAAVPATFNAGGPLAIGRALLDGTPAAFWQGSLSDIQTWTYALTPDQVTALYRQIS